LRLGFCRDALLPKSLYYPVALQQKSRSVPQSGFTIHLFSEFTQPNTQSTLRQRQLPAVVITTAVVVVVVLVINPKT